LSSEEEEAANDYAEGDDEPLSSTSQLKAEEEKSMFPFRFL
jgi:hypothetical protein